MFESTDKIAFANDCCRICTNQCESSSASIFEFIGDVNERPVEMLEYCLQQPVDTSNQLPEYICTECIPNLIETYKFFTLYKKSEEYFKELYRRWQQQNWNATTAQYDCIKVEPITIVSSNHSGRTIVNDDDDDDADDDNDVSIDLKDEPGVGDDDIYTAEVVVFGDPLAVALHEKDENNDAADRAVVEGAVEYVNSINDHPYDNDYDDDDNETKTRSEQKKGFKCSICVNQYFSEKSLLIEHEKFHIKTFECYACNNVFQRFVDLSRHIRVHPVAKMQGSHNKHHQSDAIEKPRYTLGNEHPWMGINITDGGARQFICKICGKEFPKRSCIYQHRYQMHNVGPFQCSVCRKSCVSRSSLTSHMRTHSTSQLVAHTTAALNENDGNNGAADQAVEEGAVEYVNSINEHQATEEKDSPNKNDSADEDSDNETMPRSEENKKFKCSTCAHQYFSEKSLLIAHEKFHIKIFECFHCKKVFQRSVDLSRHMKEHTFGKSRPVGKSQMSNNDHHQSDAIEKPRYTLGNEHPWMGINITDGGARQFICKICGKEFTKRYSIYQHRHDVHNVGPFLCSVCWKSCVSKASLRNHMRTHSSAELPKCPSCSRVVRGNFRMQRHLKKCAPHLVDHTAVALNENDKNNDAADRVVEKDAVEHVNSINDTPYDNDCNDDDNETTTRSVQKKEFKCLICVNQYFSEKSLLIEHEKFHVKTFECFACKKAFQRFVDLGWHMREHTVGKSQISNTAHHQSDAIEKPRDMKQKNHPWMDIIITDCGIRKFICKICRKEFPKRSYIYRHRLEYHGEHQCSVCSKDYRTKSGLRRHMQKHLPAEPPKCPSCSRVIRGKIRMQVHLEKCAPHLVAEAKTFECTLCNRKFNDEKKFERHQKKHAALKCDHCTETFKDQDILDGHLLMDHANELGNFDCTTCPEVFPLKSLLKSHAPECRKRMEGKHLCPECGKVFQYLTNLRAHMMTHNDNQPHACDKCPAKFRIKSNLMTHSRIHTGEQPFKCDIPGCERTFRYRSSLRQHKIKHAGIPRLYHCDVETCGKEFYSKHNLQIHMRIHTGERPFKCDHCERIFSQKGDMTKHLLVHLGPTPYQCLQCNESFRLKTQLRLHSYQHYSTAATSEPN